MGDWTGTWEGGTKVYGPRSVERPFALLNYYFIFNFF
jgi:hypothetical protein